MRMSLLIAGAMIVWFTAGSVAGEPKKEVKSPLIGAGALSRLRGPIERVLQFRLDGDKLKLDRTSWAAMAKPGPGRFTENTPVGLLFREIQKVAGAFSTAESGGVGEHAMSFTGRSLSGNLHVRGDVFQIRVEEAQSPQRNLQFRDDGEGGMNILAIHADGDFLLLNQARKGTFTATLVSGGQVLSKQEASFLVFLRKHHRELDAQLLPVLSHLGIQLISSPNAPRVRQAVIAQLTRTPEILAEGKSLLADLESDKFKVRDRASRLLNERFDIYKDLIQEKLRDKTLSLEPQRRLTKILSDHADWQRVDEIVAALDLTRNAEYMVSLLDHAPAAEIPRLIERLEATTGQALGNDPAAWKEWAKKMRK